MRAGHIALTATASGEAVRDRGGLELSIVRRVVQMHGGTVVADSDGPGRGARFTVVLPTAPEA